MGLKYWRFGAVALSALLLLFTGAAGAVLAADPQSNDVVFDGVATVHWADSDHGPMEGAVVRISFYHDGDEMPGIVPLGPLMDADGVAVITGVPRPAEGATPLFLDVRGDLQTSTIDEAGCTRIESWLAQSKGVAADLTVDVFLETEAQSLQLNCPAQTPTPTPGAVDPTPTPTPTATPGAVDPTPTASPSSSGDVLGATGLPQVTPPATDATGGHPAPSESPFVPALLALVALAVILTSAATLPVARVRPGPRRRN